MRLYILPHGANDNGMSYCLIAENALGDPYILQISHKMFTDAFKEYYERNEN